MSLSSKISTNIKSNISKLSSHKYKNIFLIILIIVIIVILYLIITTFVLKNTKNEIKKEGFDALTINNNSYTIINPPDSSRKVSSMYDSNHNKSMLDSPQAWSVGRSQKKKGDGSWLQMDLGSVMNVLGVVTQGRQNYEQSVVSYKVKYFNKADLSQPDDDKDWMDVDNNRTFSGNNSSDRLKKIGNLFVNPIKTQYIRIYPIDFVKYISMRAAVLTQAPILSNVKQIKIINKNSRVSDKYIQISQLAVYSIINGKETNIATLGKATASSQYNGATPVKAIDGTIQMKNYPSIYHSGASNKDESWTLELDKPYDISKIVYYNRKDCCKHRANGLHLQIYSTTSSSIPILTYELNGEDIQTFKAPPLATTQ